MYSYLQRANAAFAFALSVSFAVFGLVALSSPLVLSRLPPINPSFSVTNAAVYVYAQLYIHPFFETLMVPVLSPSFLLLKSNPDSQFSRKQGRIVYYDPNSDIIQQGKISFNLNADLRPLFNWNTKQLFISIVAEHSTKTHVPYQLSH